MARPKGNSKLNNPHTNNTNTKSLKTQHATHKCVIRIG